MPSRSATRVPPSRSPPRRTSRQRPLGSVDRVAVAADRGRREHLAAAQERDRPRAGVERLVGARERLRAGAAQHERAHDQPQLARLVGRRGAAADLVEQRAAPLPVDRPAVVGVHQREREQLVALVDVGQRRAR